jgi:hypothetical protein
MTAKKNLVKIMLMSIATAACVTFGACSGEDDPVAPAREARPAETPSAIPGAGAKTVLIYLAGGNDLKGVLKQNLKDCKEGSRRLRDNERLIVFARFRNEGESWVARLKNGEVTDSVSLKDLGICSSDGENRACDPGVMEGVMSYAFSKYPAESGNCGIVFGSHGSGWLQKKEVQPAGSRAICVDYGDGSMSDYNERWINISTLAGILRNQPHLKFIMTDCCNMMCLENLYELRTACDYLIGSPAEIPGKGAPYDQIIPDMFKDGDFCKAIIDKYETSVRGTLPLVVVKTSEMENVAQATRTALVAVKENIGNGYADMKGMIHYYHSDDTRDMFFPEYNVFYDAGDFMHTYAPTDVYQQWRQALDKAVIERRMSTTWATDKHWDLKYSDFTVTAEKFHGVSMFVPQDPQRGDYAQLNDDIKFFEWYNATGLNKLYN